MPDQDSVQALEEMEGHTKHMIDLFNQADVDLQKAKLANDSYREKHHQNASQAGGMTDAMTAIEDRIKELNTYHNTLLAQLQEAKSQAGQRSIDEESPYSQ
jgi:hypothetical protein